MANHESGVDVLPHLLGVAELLGVPYKVRLDAFGRRCLDIETAGLQYIHEVAVTRGHHEVAEHIRQMLIHGEQVSDPE